MTKSSLNNHISEPKLQQLVNNMPKEIAPERDLWLGIERAISPQTSELTNTKTYKKNVFKAPLAWAASVVVAVLLSWQINQLSPQQQDSLITPANFNAVNFLQTSFKKQKLSLLASYGQTNTKQLSKDMQQQLQQLENAQKSIAKALVNDSNNQNLLNLLQWTQQQELKLLEQLYRPRWQSI